MTQNQINYWNYVESNRHNLATEKEQVRSNKAKEYENERTNKANERIKVNTNRINSRTNKIREGELEAKKYSNELTRIANARYANNQDLLTSMQQVKQDRDYELGLGQLKVAEGNLAAYRENIAASERNSQRAKDAALGSASISAAATRYASDNNLAASKYSADTSASNTATTVLQRANESKMNITQREKELEETRRHNSMSEQHSMFRAASDFGSSLIGAASRMN